MGQLMLILGTVKGGGLAIFIGQMLDGGTSLIKGSGEQERDSIYAEDRAPANMLTWEDGSNSSVAYASAISRE
jgi:nucleoside-diphosphate-sugar epimerase